MAQLLMAHVSMDDIDIADAAGNPPDLVSDTTSADWDSEDSEEGSEDSESEEEETPLESFPADERETADTTRQQYGAGRDPQGIPWERLQVSRAEYRQQRVQRYRNYMNCIPEDDCPAVRAELIAGWPQPALLRESQWPFPFLRNWRAVASSIVHFQLRNLLWAASAHDVAVVYDNRVQHWNSVTRGVSDVLDLRGWPKGPRLPGLGRVQVSTLCVRESLLAAGGFSGELVLADMQQTHTGPAWDDEQDEQQQQQRDWQQQPRCDDDDCMSDVEQQEREQQERQQQVLVQQQVLSAAKQLYPGVQLQEQPYQQQLTLPHSRVQQQQQQRQRQQGQQTAGTWPPANQQQQQQQHAQPLCQSPPSHQQQHHQWQAHQQRQQQQQSPSSLGKAQQQQQQQQPWQQQQHRPPPHHQQQQQGEVVMGAAGPSAARVLHCCRITQSENGITNGIELFDSCNYGHCVMTSNNDCCVRLFDIETCAPRQRLPFNFAVNYATLRPAGAAPGGGAVAAVVGDDPLTWLVDLRCGVQLMQLGGHRDFSFAAAWHPDGQLLATGNQDSTTRVWDLRSPSEPLAVLGGSMGAIRSLRFSPDGAFLAAAEPADFVHVYDVRGTSSGSGGLFGCLQEIDLFGEVAGISFSPDSQSFFVAIADTLYNSLVQYQRSSSSAAVLP